MLESVKAGTLHRFYMIGSLSYNEYRQRSMNVMKKYNRTE